MPLEKALELATKDGWIITIDFVNTALLPHFKILIRKPGSTDIRMGMGSSMVEAFQDLTEDFGTDYLKLSNKGEDKRGREKKPRKKRSTIKRQPGMSLNE